METKKELAELHCHLGQSVDPAILWSIAHTQGIKLPTKNYWEFYNLITLSKTHVSWKDFHKLFYWTELIQSSPEAIERSVYEVISGAHRVNNITLIEVSFNPMFRNRGGERDLDQIILAALSGMEKALIEFPKVRAGLIFLLDRRLSFEKNKIIIERAIKYNQRGVVGVDIAGSHQTGFDYKDYVKVYQQAQEAGVKTTVHVGEDGTTEEMEKVVARLPLNRIVHGIRAVESKKLMKELVKKGLTLCICPTSNLRVGFVKNVGHLKKIIRTLWQNKVKFCINTDNPAMFRTNLISELDLLTKNKILSKKQIDQTIRWAFAATFISLPKDSHENLYL